MLELYRDFDCVTLSAERGSRLIQDVSRSLMAFCLSVEKLRRTVSMRPRDIPNFTASWRHSDPIQLARWCSMCLSTAPMYAQTTTLVLLLIAIA